MLWDLMNTKGPDWWQVNLGSGNDVVPSGIKSLPEPPMTQFYVGILHHQATMDDMQRHFETNTSAFVQFVLCQLITVRCQWPLLLTWFNFNRSMDK